MYNFPAVLRLSGTILVVVFLLLGTTIAIADIISGDSATSSASSQVMLTQLTINQPASVAEGVLLLANIVFNGNGSAAVAAPASWTQILKTSNDNRVTIISYWKAAGTAEPADYMWSIVGRTTAAGGITRYGGVDTENPVEASAGDSCQAKIATAPAITTLSPNEEVVAIFATDAEISGGGFSTPTGMTEKYDVFNSSRGPSTALDDALQAAAGDSGTKSSTMSGNRKRNWAAQQIALRPLLPPPPPPPPPPPQPPPTPISIETNAFGPTTFDQGSLTTSI